MEGPCHIFLFALTTLVNSPEDANTHTGEARREIAGGLLGPLACWFISSHIQEHSQADQHTSLHGFRPPHPGCVR